jgi:hypothetical protein
MRYGLQFELLVVISYLARYSRTGDLETCGYMCKPVSSPYLVYRPPNQIMISRNQQKIAGLAVLAVAALSVISIASPIQQADAVSNKEQSNRANQNADDNVLNVQAVVQANVQDVNVCVIAEECN